MDQFSISSLLIGLGTGLIICLIIWIQAGIKRKHIMKKYVEENERLKNHLNTQMDITSRGSEALRNDINEKQLMINNLKTTVSTLQEKPNRDKLRMLYIYDKAIHLMFEKHPGFATMWVSVLKEAETDYEEKNSGIKPLIRKVFKPSLSVIAAKASSYEEENE